MRNPIPSSPERPVALPDCILLDAWWADLKDDTRGRTQSLRVISSRGERDDRDGEQRRG